MIGRSTIRKKLTVIVMLTSSVALVLACVSFATYELISVRRSMPAALAVLAESAAERSRPALREADAALVRASLGQSLQGQPQVILAALYLPDGKVLAQYRSRSVSPTLAPPPLASSGHVFGNDHLDVYHEIRDGSRHLGTLLVRSDLRALHSRLVTYGNITGVVFAVSLLVALLLCSRLQRFVSDPILKLAGITAQVARDQNYALRVVQPSADEIGMLYGSFNEMLNQVQQRDDALREAHHELEARVVARTADLSEAHALLKAELEERGRAEDALRGSQQRIAALINSIDGVVWEADPETFQFRFVSEQAENLLGYPLAQWTGETEFWKRRVHPEDRQRAVEFIRQAVAKRKAHHFEYRVLAADGRVVWVRDSATLVHQAGQPAVLRGVLQDITEQKKAEQELESITKQLMETSRQAGMAEVATGVLHNVGNVLNSVNVSATLVCERVRRSKLPSLCKATDLINRNLANLPLFVASDKGRLLPSYLSSLAATLTEEQAEIHSELARLSKNIEHIKEIVAMQQSYARVSGVVETLDMKDLIEDSLQFNAAAYARHGVEVVRQYQGSPKVCVDKHKVVQVLINLFNNAKYAMEKNSGRPKRLVISLSRTPNNTVRVTIADNGMGIPKENLTRIFNHGFTTRKDGHGFGLHSGALAAREMGGSLTAYSAGPGFGATFTLEVPLAEEQVASLAA